jgi:hypothetical protein
MMTCPDHVYTSEDRQRIIIGDGDPDARFLLCGKGTEVSDEQWAEWQAKAAPMPATKMVRKAPNK